MDDSQAGDASKTRRRPRPALSIVIPVYNGADSIGELVGALEELTIAGGHEIVLVNDGSPDDSLAVCRGAGRRAPGADHAGQSVAQLRRAQRGDGRAAPRAAAPMSSPWTTICRTRPRRSSACSPSRRESGKEVVYTYLRREAARALAQPRQPLHQLGRRLRARQAEGVLPLELPLHERLRRARDHPLRRALSLCRRADPAGDAGHRPAAGAPSAARRRPQQLHAAPAVAAVAQHVRQFLGDAAAASAP